MAEISTRVVRALTDRHTDIHTDKQTTVTLLRMRRGLITRLIIFVASNLQTLLRIEKSLFQKYKHMYFELNDEANKKSPMKHMDNCIIITSTLIVVILWLNIII